ncbi:serpin family protein [Streptomyces sp. PTM05]|uniref:Serpin family protein n=1 Tax=Streptantibioticus parmotrematis TaxID=2873249 RepID=A0ABS7QKS1_9ACTN|nr:serpin family protein [Streptantibioticus parmotrematis]MBY8883366.1 serpin family protein [Streptantibioticus parmotrematis]
MHTDITRGRRGRRTAARYAAGLTALAALGGCASGPADATLVRAARATPRQTAPVADQRAAAAATTAFGADLYHALAAGAAGHGNLALAPSGLADAMGMLLPGARGTTASQIASVLHTSLPAQRFAVALGTLEQGELTRATGDKATLRESDALWTQSGYGIQQPYLRTLAAAFGTGAHTVDFASDPGAARHTIDDTVSDETDGAVKDLFPSDALTRDTRFALTDAVYFDAKWQQPFDHDADSRAPFHLLGGSTADVRMMNHAGEYGYAQGSGWQAVELPYRGGDFAMDLIVPDSGGFTRFASGLTADQLTSVLGGLKSRPMMLSMPGFGFDSGEALGTTLAGLGMPAALDPGRADFGGIPTRASDRLHVQSVVQKTRITVNDTGTTAAAGSGITGGAGAAPAPGRPVVVDRPFLFVIRDLHSDGPGGSGRILFLGQVTDPRG